MPTFAELIAGSALETSAKPSQHSPGQGIAAGVELAKHVQNVQLQREQLEQQKVEQEQAKVGKFIDALEKGSKYTGTAQSNFYKGALPKIRDALGLTEMFPDETLQFVTASPENIARVNAVIADVRSGKVKESDAYAIIRDPVAFADISPIAQDFDEKISDAGKQYLNNQAQMQRQELGFGNQKERDNTANKLKLADDLSKFAIPDLKVGFAQLDTLVPGGLKGFKGGAIPGVTGTDAKIPINQLTGKGLQVRQAAQGIANNILKQRSGGAVSDGEATRLLSEIGMVPAIGEGGGLTAVFKGSPTPESFVNGMLAAQDKLNALENTYKRAYGEQLYNEVAGGTPEISRKPKTKDKKSAVQITAAQVKYTLEKYGEPGLKKLAEKLGTTVEKLKGAK